MDNPTRRMDKCDFCDYPLEFHTWSYCIKNGVGRRYPYIPPGRRLELASMFDVNNSQISAGGVYRFTLLDNGHYGFIDGPEIVEITEDIATRCEPSGRLYYIDGDKVAEYVDPVTSEHYGQPIDDSDSEEGEAEQAEAEGQ